MTLSSEVSVGQTWDAAPYGVALVGTDGRITWTNAAFGALVPATMVGTHELSLRDVTTASGTTLEHLTRDVARTGTSMTDVRMSVAVPGGTRKLSAMIHPVRTADATVTGVCCLLTDVTEEAKLVEGLWQSQKLEAAGHLANVFAHDFNNWLTVIQGYCDLLLMKVGDEMVRDRLGKIRGAAIAAAGLSRQLLLMTRPTDGTVTAIDLNLALRAMKTALDRVLPPNIRRTIDLEETLGLAYTNAARLEQIVMTLVNQACNAMSEGGTLGVSTSAQTLSADDAAALGLAPGPYVRLTVRDSGRRTGATGSDDELGMATIRTIMHQLQGAVSVASESGAETSVSVWFRRAAAIVDDTTLLEGDPSSRQTTVLLADSDLGVGEALATGLGAAGFTIIRARTVAEATAVARTSSTAIHALVTGDIFEDGSGLALAQEAGNIRPGIAVLVLTSRSDAAASPFRSVAKPFTIGQLIAALETVIASAGPARSL